MCTSASLPARTYRSHSLRRKEVVVSDGDQPHHAPSSEPQRRPGSSLSPPSGARYVSIQPPMGTRRPRPPRMVVGLVAVVVLVAVAVLILRQDTAGSRDTAVVAGPAADHNTATPDEGRGTLNRSTSVGDLLGLRTVVTTLTLTAGGSSAEATIWRLGGAGSVGTLDLLCFSSVDTAEHSGDQPDDPHVAVTVDTRHVTFSMTPHDGPVDTITATVADGCSVAPTDGGPNPGTSQPGIPTPDTSSAPGTPAPCVATP